MATLAQASLTDVERRAIKRLISSLRERFGSDVDSVWLYGSRARGEPPSEESDVDLLVLLRDPSFERAVEVSGLAHRAADMEGARSYFSVRVNDREWLNRRRAIESFFMRELDRDKIVLFGQP
jgi:predicted nucleotidyltransferase